MPRAAVFSSNGPCYRRRRFLRPVHAPRLGSARRLRAHQCELLRVQYASCTNKRARPDSSERLYVQDAVRMEAVIFMHH